MELTVNSVVLSLRGHDAGGVFAVVGFADGAHALVADGKRRKIEKPKKKKLRHLRLIGRLDPPQLRELTNRHLRIMLRTYDSAAVSGGGN